MPENFTSALTTPEREEFQRSLHSSDLYIDYFGAIPQLTAAERQKSVAKWTATNDRRVYLVDKKLAGNKFFDTHEKNFLDELQPLRTDLEYVMNGSDFVDVEIQ